MIDGGSKQTIAASSRYKTVGMIKMNKRSMNPDITNDNPLYSMEGITYGVYVTNTCGPEGDTGKTLVLDESGYAEVGGLYSGTYFIREIESSGRGHGYAHDPTIYNCWVDPRRSELASRYVKRRGRCRPKRCHGRASNRRR